MKENFKNKLYSHQSPIDHDEIWKSMEDQVKALNEEKRKKRRFFFFMVFASFLLALTTVSLFQLNKSESKFKSSDAGLESIKKNSEGQINDKENVSIEASTKQIAGDASSELQNQPARTDKDQFDKLNESTIASMVDQQDDPGVSIIKTAKSSVIEEHKDGSRKNNAITEKTKQQSTNTNNDLMSSEFNLHGLKESSITSQANDENQHIISLSTSRNENEKAVEHTIISESMQQSKEGSSLGPLTQNEHKKIGFQNHFNILDQIDLLNLGLFELSNNLTYQYLQPKYGSKSYQSAQQPWTFDIGLNAGAYVLSRSLIAKRPEFESHRNTRLNTETTLEAIEYGLDFTANHKSGLHASIGYFHTDLNERFEAAEITIDSIMVWAVTERVIDFNQDTVEIYGDVLETTKTETTYDIYNRYRLVDLPISIGYSKVWDTWKVGVRGGVMVNLALKTKGRILNEDLNVVELSAINQYKNKVSMSYFVGFTAQRTLSNKFDIRLVPTFKFYPNFLEDSAGLSSKYALLGGSVSLVYKLN